MANNNNLFNAALGGAAAGIASRWLTNTNSASYAAQAALITDFATAFDAAIPTDPSGGSRGQCQVANDICAAFCNGRILTAAMDMDLVVAPLVALYNELAPDLEPDAGGGGGAPIPRTYWVSPLSVGSSEDGSASNPFLTGQAAIDALELEGVGGTLLLACGQGVNFGPMVCTSVDIALVGFGNLGSNSADRPFVNVTVAGGIRFSAANIAVSFTVSPGAGANLTFSDCFLFTCNLQDCIVWQMLNCDGVIVTLSASTVILREAANCRLTGIGSFGNTLVSALLKNCLVTGGILASDLTLLNTPVPGAGVDQITCDTLTAQESKIDCQVNVSTSSTLDQYTLQSLRDGALAHAFTHTLGTFTISDHPLTVGVTFTVPVLAGADADVGAALPGCVPGDTFDVTTTTRLPGVIIGDAFCDVSGTITLRFFGTTPGGDVVCNININTNSPNAIP